VDSGLNLPVLREGLIAFLVLIVSICIHEWAHAFTADRLGDDTPARQGRVTLNPMVHMDLLGSVIFPLVYIFIFPGVLLFGWGRPVALNVSNFQHRRRDEVITTLAGPLANLGLALLGAVVGGLIYRSDPRTAELFGQIIAINVQLAVFNLIPLPPLDGGTVLRHAVGMREETYYALARWSFLLLLVAFYLPPVRTLLSGAMELTGRPFVDIYRVLAAR
jgi:Zn-dependent protease